MYERAPVYRVTVEMLESPEPYHDTDMIGVYCFDTGKRPIEYSHLDASLRRVSFDVRTHALALYLCSPRLNFTFGPYYKSPARLAVEGDI